MIHREHYTKQNISVHPFDTCTSCENGYDISHLEGIQIAIRTVDTCHLKNVKKKIMYGKKQYQHSSVSVDNVPVYARSSNLPHMSTSGAFPKEL